MGADVHGVLLVDKPKGPTSFDIVAQARRAFGTRAVGHAGTLDPMATGLLVLLFGEATKLSGILTGAEKTYVAEVSFGTATDTLDAQGVVTERCSTKVRLDAQAVAAALERERQRTRQTPPAHSALKVEGRRAYALARQGQAVELDERPVAVRFLELEGFEPERLRVRLRVSKGYYVRAFARDLCASLGIPGHLSALRRTASGAFELDGAIPWPPREAPPPPLTVAEAAKRALPGAELTPEGVLRARHGKALRADDFERAPATEELHAWFAPTGQLVALGVGTDAGFRVQRGFSAASSRT